MLGNVFLEEDRREKRELGERAMGGKLPKKREVAELSVHPP